MARIPDLFADTVSKRKSYSYVRQTKILVNTIKNVENHYLFGDQWWILCSKSIIHTDIHQHTHHLFLLCSHSSCPWSNRDQHQSLVPTHSNISHDQRSHTVNYQGSHKFSSTQINKSWFRFYSNKMVKLFHTS